MDEQITLLELEQRPASESSVAPAIPMERLKLRRPERRQVTFRAIEVEQLVAARADAVSAAPSGLAALPRTRSPDR